MTAFPGEQLQCRGASPDRARVVDENPPGDAARIGFAQHLALRAEHLVETRPEVRALPEATEQTTHVTEVPVDQDLVHACRLRNGVDAKLLQTLPQDQLSDSFPATR
jgi:hypothetical protein